MAVGPIDQSDLVQGLAGPIPIGLAPPAPARCLAETAHEDHVEGVHREQRVELQVLGHVADPAARPVGGLAEDFKRSGLGFQEAQRQLE